MAAQCNYSIPNEQCTLETCCTAQGFVDYVPTLAGNTVYLVIFALLLLAQSVLGLRQKTWGFLIGMTCGCILEVLGYGGRIWMHSNLFTMNAFLLYLVPLTIAPAFLTASIYLTLGRLIVVYGEPFSRFRPGTYTIIFVTCDIISLVLQAAGGAITSIADPGTSLQDTGVNIMIAGLSFQVASLAIFMILGSDFAVAVWRRSRRGTPMNPTFAALRANPWFRLFQPALALATVTIFVRCAYRVAELKDGFSGSLANDEVTFMILEGPMVFIAVGLLTVFHPGLAFRGQWRMADFSFRRGAKHTQVERVEEKGLDSDVELQKAGTAR